MTLERPGARVESGASDKEPREIRRLKLSVEHGDRVLTGELTFGGTIRSDLIAYLEDTQEKGFEIGALRDKVLRLIERIPAAELNNIFDKVEQYLAEGDNSTALLWQNQAATLLAEYEANGAIDVGTAMSMNDRLRNVGEFESWKPDVG